VWGSAWRPSDSAGSGVIRLEDAPQGTVDRFAHSLVSVAELLHDALAVEVTAHVYRSAGQSRPILGYHTDPYDTLIVALGGTKVWTLCLPRSAGPTQVAEEAQLMEIRKGRIAGCTPYSEAEVHTDPTLRCEELVLKPGHLLYLPKGVIHRARAVSPHGTEHVTYSLGRVGTSLAHLLARPAAARDPLLPERHALALTTPLPLHKLHVCDDVCLDQLTDQLRNVSAEPGLTRSAVRRRLYALLAVDRSLDATWPGRRPAAQPLPPRDALCDLPEDDDPTSLLSEMRKRAIGCTCECSAGCDGDCAAGCDDAPCTAECDASCDASCTDCCTQDCDEGCLCSQVQGGSDCDEGCSCTYSQGGRSCDSSFGLTSCDDCPVEYCTSNCDECPSQYCSASCDTCTCGCTAECDDECDADCANGCDDECTSACDDECDGCCATPSPTAPPTPQPTPRPTVLPTSSPTRTPTVAPSPAPPTPQPTGPPTPKPTRSPTASPTARPTASPTPQPTVAPTKAPTVTPTTVPTPMPSAAPTTSPTPFPTASPTVASFSGCSVPTAPCSPDTSSCYDASDIGHFVCECLEGHVAIANSPAVLVRGRTTIDGSSTVLVSDDLVYNGDRDELPTDPGAPVASWGNVSYGPPTAGPVSCTDVDECATTDLCNEEAVCANIVGGFRCACEGETLGYGLSSCIPRNTSAPHIGDLAVFVWPGTCATTTHQDLMSLHAAVVADLGINEGRVHIIRVQCESLTSSMLILFAFSEPSDRALLAANSVPGEGEGEGAGEGEGVAAVELTRADVLNLLVNEIDIVGASAGALDVIPVGGTMQVDVDISVGSYYEPVDEKDDDTSPASSPTDGAVTSNPFADGTLVLAVLAGFIICFLVVVIALRVRHMNKPPPPGSPMELAGGVYSAPSASGTIGVQQGYDQPPNRDKYQSIAAFSSLGVDVEFLIDGDELTRTAKLGEGAFGLVLRGTWGDKAVAIKEVKGTSAEAMRQLIDEGQKLIQLPPHANVVMFYGVCDAPPAIVLQFCDGGSLLSRLYGRKPGTPLLSSSEMQSIALDIARGLNHLHFARLVHRDVAARNVLLHRGVAKLTDMGMARDSIEAGGDDGLGPNGEPVANYFQQTKSTTGPLKWMAHEQLTSRSVSFKADVYAYGIVLYEMYACEAPWAGLSAIEAAAKVIGGATHKIAPRAPALVAACMVAAFRQDPHDRPSMRQVVAAIVEAYGPTGLLVTGEPLNLVDGEDPKERPEVAEALASFFTRTHGNSYDEVYGSSPALEPAAYDNVPVADDDEEADLEVYAAMYEAIPPRRTGQSRSPSRRRKKKRVGGETSSPRAAEEASTATPARPRSYSVSSSPHVPSGGGSRRASRTGSRGGSRVDSRKSSANSTATMYDAIAAVRSATQEGRTSFDAGSSGRTSTSELRKSGKVRLAESMSMSRDGKRR